MNFLSITSDAEHIFVNFGIYGGMNFPTGTAPFERQYFRQDLRFGHEKDVENENNVDSVHVKDIIRNEDYSVTIDGATGTLKVDTVNGTTPTTNKELFDLLKVL